MSTLHPSSPDLEEPPHEVIYLAAPPGPMLAGPQREIRSRTASPLKKSGLALLGPEELPSWDEMVEQSDQCSVFVKSWWLKAACGEARILGFFEAGRLLAGIPLHFERRMGIKMCIMPKLTQTLGVVMRPLSGKLTAQGSREIEILDAFANHLEQLPVFIQAFHPSMQNWLPFYWRGFTQTTHYTHVFEDLSSLSNLWEGLDKDRRNNIRKARRLGLVVKECGPETVYQVARSSFERQKKKCPFTLEYLCRLYEAGRSHNAAVCMAVVDGRGQVHAGEFMVWDAKRSYGIAGGHDTALGTSGATVLLKWTLVEFASTRTQVFDFEGSMCRSIEASFRSFGTRRVGYQRIIKMPVWMRMGLGVAGRHQI